MKKILIVNVNWLGDVLFSTATIRAVKKLYPESEVYCMVVPRCKEILENNPYLNGIILFDERTTHRSLFKKIKFISELRKQRFDIAYLLHRSFTRTLIIFLAGIPERVGYYTRKRAFLLTKKILPPYKELHRLEYYLNLVKPQNEAFRQDNYYEFFITRQDRDFINKFLEENKISKDDFLVVINPAANWQPKRWGKDKFAKLADRLIQGYQAKVIITGAEKDLKLAQEIKDMMKTEPIIACGKTNLKQLAALLERTDLVISADSGPMHIAIALGTKVIALFGPTSSSITGPHGKNENYVVIQKDMGCKVPCYDTKCRDYRCMDAINIEDVLEAVRKIKENI